MGKVAKSTKKFLKKKEVSARGQKKNSSSSGGGVGGSGRKFGGGKKKKETTPATAKEKEEISIESPEAESSDDDEFDHSAGFVTQDLDNIMDDSNSEEDGSDDDDGESLQDLSSDDERSEKDEGADDDEQDFDMGINMQELKDSDPNFYQYLLENDKNLLEFDPSQGIVAEDGASQSGSENEQPIEEEESMEHDGNDLVTREMIHKWRASIAKTFSIKTLKKIVLAFKAAASFGEEDDGLLRYRVADEKVFNLTLLTAIKYAPIVMDHYLYGEQQDEKSSSSKKPLPSSLNKWKKIKVICKSFLSSLLKVLKKITSLSMTKFAIKTSEKTVSYFACFPKLCKDFLKEMLQFWASSTHEQIRILSFICIRRLALAAPNPHLDRILKGSYQKYLETSRNTSHYTWTQIQFMGNCIVELGGLFLASTYQHGFVALRQLAIQLRQASTTKTKESFKLVYNWQFVHALKVWAQVFSTYGPMQDPKEQLKPLIYPLVQIIIGVMRLKPSSKYFPFRLCLVRLLISITEKTGVYIPVASYLFEIFESNEMKSKPKPSTLKPLDFQLSIRAPNQFLGTKTYHNGLLEEVVHLLFHFYSTQAKSIAFPELAIPAIIHLRKIVKGGKDVAMSRQINQLIEKIDQNSKVIEQERNKVDFGPQDSEAVKSFLRDTDMDSLPLYKYFQSRMKVISNQVKKEMTVSKEDSDEDDLSTMVAPPKRQSKQYIADDLQLNEDLVEDFELSSEEDEESD